MRPVKQGIDDAISVLDVMSVLLTPRKINAGDLLFRRDFCTASETALASFTPESRYQLNYQSTAEWAEAVRTEILSVFLPAKPRFEAPPELGYRADELEQAVREWQTEQQVKGSIVYSRELLEYELKETERLNAMIMKQTRHCAELKLWEEARDRT